MNRICRCNFIAFSVIYIIITIILYYYIFLTKFCNEFYVVENNSMLHFDILSVLFEILVIRKLELTPLFAKNDIIFWNSGHLLILVM